MSVNSACQLPVEGEEEDEDDEIQREGHNEMLREEPNRQVGKRHQFTLYEKMVAVCQFQRNVEVNNLSIWATCKATILQHKQLISWKREIVLMQEKWNKKAKSLCEGPASVLHPIEEQLLCHIFVTLSGQHWQ